MTPERRRDILQISLPIVAGMTSQNLLNLVDAWMVGALGATALAAVGLASFVNFMAVSFLTGFSPAVQTLAARRVGQGRMTEVAVPLNGGLRLSLWIGVPLAVLGWWGAEALMTLLTPDAAVIVEGEGYLQWRLLSVAAVGMNFCYRGYWSAIKRTQVYMVTLFVMNALNVPISFGLIHGLWGLPQMGTAGAGLGTSISVLIGTAFYVIYAYRHARPHGYLRAVPSADENRALLRLGVPNAVQQLMFSGGFTVLFWMIARIGTAELAVSHILITLMLTLILPSVGFGIAAATLASQALGRGDVDDAAQAAWDTYRIALWVYLAAGLPMVLAPEWLLGWFLHEPATLALGVVPLQLLGLMMAGDGLGIILMQALLGAGASRYVMWVATGLQWGLFLPLVGWLGPVSGLGLTVVWLAMAAYRLLQAGFFVVAWRRRHWARIQL